jgi:GTPase
LEQLGIDPQNDPEHQHTMIEVWNKIDRLDTHERARLANIAERKPAEQRPVLVSAITGQGIDALCAAIEDRLSVGRVVIELQLDPADGAGVSWLHRHTEVLRQAMDENGRFAMTVRAAPDKVNSVRAKFGLH